MESRITWIRRFVQAMKFSSGAHGVFEQLKQDMMQECWHHWETDLSTSYFLGMLHMYIRREYSVIVLKEYELG